jgi:hypothetical protein
MTGAEHWLETLHEAGPDDWDEVMDAHAGKGHYVLDDDEVFVVEFDDGSAVMDYEALSPEAFAEIKPRLVYNG